MEGCALLEWAAESGHRIFSGKTIIPFNTNAGYGVGSGFATVEELCTRSKVVERIFYEGRY